MKKIIVRTALVTLLSVLLVVITLKISKSSQENKDLIDRIKTMPDLEYKLILDSMSNQWRKHHSTTIINFFNTECDYCKNEIIDILNHQYLFENSVILLVSEQPIDTLTKFCTRNGIDTIPNIYMGQVNYLDIIECFGEVIYPTTFIYDKNRNLINKYFGQIRAVTIAEEIENYYLKNEF